MSLVLVLANAESLVGAADTREYDIKEGPLKVSADKVRILETKSGPLLVVAAGDSEVDGVHMLKQSRG
jgi:hypothetical protein